MSYINKEDLLAKAKAKQNGVFAAPVILNLIEKAPEVDVVEVVRCKDCKWWKNGELCRNVNGLNSIVWNGEWFCASGQRKEGAEE